MFHLYFGAFDIVLYLGGTYVALVLADAICSNLESPKATQVSAPTATIQPRTQATLPRSLPFQAERAAMPQRVTVQG